MRGIIGDGRGGKWGRGDTDGLMIKSNDTREEAKFVTFNVYIIDISPLNQDGGEMLGCLLALALKSNPVCFFDTSSIPPGSFLLCHGDDNGGDNIIWN